MQFHHPDMISVTVFLLVVAFVLLSLLAGTYAAATRLNLPARKLTVRLGLGLLVWLGLTSALVASGALRTLPMPGIPLFLGTVILTATAFGLSPPGKLLAVGLPIWVLVAFQGFRLPLELVLHSWVQQGTIPETMTWTGRNFDILSGIVALAAAPLASRWRAVAWVANVVGLTLLLNVGRVAMLSSPLPFAWRVDPPLQLVFHLPYAWIGPVCVAGALAGHIVLTRALTGARSIDGVRRTTADGGQYELV